MGSDLSHSHQDSKGHSLGPVEKTNKKHPKRHKSWQFSVLHIHFTVEITVRPWCGNPIVDVPILGVGEQRMLPPCRFPELLHGPINLWMTPERSVEFLSCDLSTNCCAWLLKKCCCFCMFPKTYQQKLVQCSCSCQISFLFSIGREMSWNAPLCLHQGCTLHPCMTLRSLTLPWHAWCPARGAKRHPASPIFGEPKSVSRVRGKHNS